MPLVLDKSLFVTCRRHIELHFSVGVVLGSLDVPPHVRGDVGFPPVDVFVVDFQVDTPAVVTLLFLVLSCVVLVPLLVRSSPSAAHLDLCQRHLLFVPVVGSTFGLDRATTA